MQVVYTCHSMKVKSSVKAEPTKGDILVKRRGILYRINKLKPRRNLKQGTNKKVRGRRPAIKSAA